MNFLKVYEKKIFALNGKNRMVDVLLIQVRFLHDTSYIEACEIRLLHSMNVFKLNTYHAKNVKSRHVCIQLKNVYTFYYD